MSKLTLARFKSKLVHYPDPEIGDKIKIGTGRAIWTIIHISEDLRIGCKGWTLLHLENATGSSHRNCYLEDAKFV